MISADEVRAMTNHLEAYIRGVDKAIQARARLGYRECYFQMVPDDFRAPLIEQCRKAGYEVDSSIVAMTVTVKW